MVDNYSACLSINMFIIISKLNGVVICDEYHMPISMLMDLESIIFYLDVFKAT